VKNTNELLKELQSVEEARAEITKKYQADLAKLIEWASLEAAKCDSTPRSKSHLLPKSYLLYEWEHKPSEKAPEKAEAEVPEQRVLEFGSVDLGLMAFVCFLFLIFWVLLLMRM
jgi:hypothetical protein